MSITEQLNPSETALLYSALLYYKTQAETAHADCVMNKGSKLHTAFFSHTVKECKQLIAKLFGDTFVDELDFVKHFNQQWEELNQKRERE